MDSQPKKEYICDSVELHYVHDLKSKNPKLLTMHPIRQGPRIQTIHYSQLRRRFDERRKAASKR